MASKKGSLERKLVLVTGAANGIGRAIASGLAKQGARIVAVDIDEAKLAALKAELGDACVMAQRADVSKKDEMAALATDVSARVGVLDVLVNNAGVGHAGGVLDSTLEDWEWVLGVNLWGVIHGCHAFVPKMVARGGWGHVVNVASTFGLMAAPGVAPYCTSKFAVAGLTESLRAELAPHGIGVSAICPGLIKTDIAGLGRYADESRREPAKKLFAKRGHPPEDVARAVAHAIRHNVAVVPVGVEAWAAWLGKRVSPGLVELAARSIDGMAKSSSFGG